MVTLTFEENYLTIFHQRPDGTYAQAQQQQITNLHEGMDVCDLDGDGDVDIAANGYWLANPGAVDQLWPVASIDAQWHNQTGDWSRNATKVACADLDADGQQEVLLTHSERAGYPVAHYQLRDAATNTWDQTVLLDSLVAAHNLQVFDFDLDGDPDILTGVNRSRAWNLDVRDYPVYLLQNPGWDTLRIHSEGIYNGQVSDYDGDGDYDIFRYPTHDDTLFQVLINQVIAPPAP